MATFFTYLLSLSLSILFYSTLLARAFGLRLAALQKKWTGLERNCR